MLHQFLNLKRKLIIFDTETTGLDIQTTRIVELAFQVFEPENGLTKEWRSLVNPGVPIPEDVAKVHGITDVKIQSCRVCEGFKNTEGPFCTCEVFHPWPTFAHLAASLATGFSNCDYAGKNVRFDLRILAQEFRRVSVRWSYADARIVDADRLEQLTNPRTLSHLYEKYTGQKLDGAHAALTDVRATTDVLTGQLETYPNLPRDLDELHALQWPGWIDTEGKFRFVNGVPCFSRWGKHADKPMKDPSVNKRDQRGESYWDFILKADFSPEIKRIAEKAKLGQFPEAK